MTTDFLQLWKLQNGKILKVKVGNWIMVCTQYNRCSNVLKKSSNKSMHLAGSFVWIHTALKIYCRDLFEFFYTSIFQLINTNTQKLTRPTFLNYMKEKPLFWCWEKGMLK